MAIVRQIPNLDPQTIAVGQAVLLYLRADSDTSAILEAEEWCAEHGLRRVQEARLPTRSLDNGFVYLATCYRPYPDELQLERQGREQFERRRDLMPLTPSSAELLNSR